MMWMRPVRHFRRAYAHARSYCFYEPLDLVTGMEKRELLAHLAGECDPYRMRPIKKGPGTYERPNLIPSAFSYRIVSCVCSPEDHHVEHMVLHQGCPKRCGCGHWFELCPIAAL